ncbi:hypothetical protein [Sansalvadorimonas verongulae]|uniref:hypothetical protein n=1 Tax=Sansalvadorimonas verongulae TaxID=2172824 RepID=UPI0012BCF853|nr:hypothetical protein [Sansalvadorimonas verongulae]MTI15520.1 hypothetical protein [Sansalvadorimonas verongulae]
MSMNVGGGGGVRPLGPQTQPQQPRVKQPAVGNSQQPPQGKLGQAGRILRNINSFNSQPVSNDLQQLQQWLNKLKGGPATSQQAPVQKPGSDLQMAQIKKTNRGGARYNTTRSPTSHGET